MSRRTVVRKARTTTKKGWGDPIPTEASNPKQSLDSLRYKSKALQPLMMRRSAERHKEGEIALTTEDLRNDIVRCILKRNKWEPKAGLERQLVAKLIELPLWELYIPPESTFAILREIAVHRKEIFHYPLGEVQALFKNACIEVEPLPF